MDRHALEDPTTVHLVRSDDHCTPPASRPLTRAASPCRLPALSATGLISAPLTGRLRRHPWTLREHYDHEF